LNIGILKSKSKYCYFAYIPRSVRKTYKLFTLFKGLKNRIIQASLYCNNSTLIMAQSPIVVCFNNDLPPINQLSVDRWQIYQILYMSSGEGSLAIIYLFLASNKNNYVRMTLILEYATDNWRNTDEVAIFRCIRQGTEFIFRKIRNSRIIWKFKKL